MGLSRIINSEQSRPAGENAENAVEKLEQYFGRMLPELNLRLFLEEQLPAENVLWIEDLKITAYKPEDIQYPIKKERFGLLRYLTGLMAKLRSRRK